jgi:hypothetical protein
VEDQIPSTGCVSTQPADCHSLYVVSRAGIRHVTVRRVDLNGPRRGVDTRCSITVDLAGARRIFVAVRDVVMALAAFTLARLADVREEAPAFRHNHVIEQPQRRVTV